MNTLICPGGTRSRSGAIEKKLKQWLLSTVLESQQILCATRSEKKVFVVPLVISYHFVLEAAFLIEQHLKITGKENYIRLKDEGTSVRAWLRFIWRFFTTSSDITLSIGKPMDVLGNFVDAQGRSFDQNNNELDIREYFVSRNEVNEDREKDDEEGGLSH